MKKWGLNLFYILSFTFCAQITFAEDGDYYSTEERCKREIEYAYETVQNENRRAREAYWSQERQKDRDAKSDNGNNQAGQGSNLFQQMAQISQQEAQLEQQRIEQLGAVDDKVHEEMIKYTDEKNKLINTVYERDVEAKKIDTEAKEKQAELKRSCDLEADTKWTEYYAKIDAQSRDGKFTCGTTNCATGEKKYRTGNSMDFRKSKLWKSYKMMCEYNKYGQSRDISRRKEAADYALVKAAEEVAAKKEQLEQKLPMILDHYDAQKQRITASNEIQKEALAKQRELAMVDALMNQNFQQQEEKKEEQTVVQANNSEQMLGVFEHIRERCDRTHEKFSKNRNAPPVTIPADYLSLFANVESACKIDCVRSSGQLSTDPASSGINRGQ